VDRSSTSDMGIMRVLAGPPGASAFTVTPVPPRSFAQMTVEDSSAAWRAHRAKIHPSSLCRSWSRY
jgi:hypothetical protein